MKTSKDERAWTDGVLALGLGIVGAMLVTYAVHGSMPANPVGLPYEARVHTSLWAPEGWKFFTRDPREERALVFAREPDGTFHTAMRGPNASPSNLFGIDRSGRAQGVELGLLLHDLAPEAFADCDDRPAECLGRAEIVAELANASPRPTICGDVGFALQKPVPWAWAKRSPVMPSRIARVKVAC